MSRSHHVLRIALSPRSLAIALVVAGVAAFGVQRADASCGDYVVIGNSQAMHDHQPMDAKPATMPSHAPVNQPCEGPSCRSQSRPMPLAPPTVPERSSHDQLACFLASNLTTLPFSAPYPSESPAHADDGHPWRIEHPPRLAR